MKRFTFLALVSGGLLLGGIGCGDDDDDDDGSSAGSSGAADGGAGSDGGPGTYDCGGDQAECDLLNADNCEEGYGCQFLLPASGDGAAYAQCSQAGNGTDGDACDANTPCGPGFHCHDGICHKYCCEYGASSECPTDQACVIELYDGKGVISDVSVCDACDECNPLTLDGCDVGQGCYPITPEGESENSGCRLCLTSIDEKGTGEACEAVNECAPGLGCYSVEGGDAQCVPFCDLEADPDACQDGTICQDSAGSTEMGLQVGICLTAD